jgi:hypothetical protein
MTTYPHLRAYIDERNKLPNSAAWCAQLRLDERAALEGQLSEVAADLEQAQSDYAEAQRKAGGSLYPYNSAMGEFLGLPLRSNGEPGHGYYMASRVLEAFKTGAAERAVRDLIAQGRPLRIVAARDKATRKPIRFHQFSGPQIVLNGNSVECCNDKRRVRLSSNWSQSSCLAAVRLALETGNAYGER